MKNEYVKPEMLVVGLDSEGVLAQSIGIGGEGVPYAPERRDESSRSNAWKDYENQ